MSVFHAAVYPCRALNRQTRPTSRSPASWLSTEVTTVTAARDRPPVDAHDHPLAEEIRLHPYAVGAPSPMALSSVDEMVIVGHAGPFG